MGQKDPFKTQTRGRPRRIEQSASRPSFEARISQAAKELEEKAWQMPPGSERDHLLRRARLMNTTEHLREWLSSPGLQPPK
jgi:hypothetical protein